MAASRRESDMSDLMSPPRSPHYESAPGSEEEVPSPKLDAHLDDEDEHYAGGRTTTSSPPTSIDHKRAAHGGSAQSSLSGLGDVRPPSVSLSQYSDHEDTADAYRYRTAGYADPESQWESEGPNMRQKPGASAARKSAIPSSSKIFPRSTRHSTSSTKLHLPPSTTRSRAPQDFYNSRASSASYGLHQNGEPKKAPLVLLHLTLLLLPGAEEPILRKITPTMLERGMLIEHPRSDYQLLEELIFDALGLDDALEPEFEKIADDDTSPDAWEKSMGVRRIEGRDRWELRVYAANGLMTPGAWRRVWSEMERIDVEVGPKSWRGEKTEELIRNFSKSSGGNGVKDPATMETPSTPGTPRTTTTTTTTTEKATKTLKKMERVLRETSNGVWAAVGAVTLVSFVALGLFYSLRGSEWSLTDRNVLIDYKGGDIGAMEPIYVEDTHVQESTTPDEEVVEIINETVAEGANNEPVYCDTEDSTVEYCPEDEPENILLTEQTAETGSELDADADASTNEVLETLESLEDGEIASEVDAAAPESNSPTQSAVPFGQRSCIQRPTTVVPTIPIAGEEAPSAVEEDSASESESVEEVSASESETVEATAEAETEPEELDDDLETSLFEDTNAKASWWKYSLRA